MSRRIIAEVSSPVSGPLNPAYVGFSFASSTVTGDELASDILQYLMYTMFYNCENGCSVTGMKIQALPAGPLISLPFPTTEAAAWATYTGATPMTAWGQVIPTLAVAQRSSGRGDSLCVNTVTGSGTRGGVGRHFIPFLSRDAVGTDGLIDATYATAVNLAYDVCFNGTGVGAPPAWSVASPVVYSVSEAAEYAVISANTQRIPSRLRSRTK